MNESERLGRLAEAAFDRDAVRAAMRAHADRVFEQARAYRPGLRPAVPADVRRDPDGQIVYTITTLEETR